MKKKGDRFIFLFFGHLAEKFVFLELKQKGYDVYYFRNKQEVDFYALHEHKKSVLINVAWEISPLTTKEREVSALRESMAALILDNALLLTERIEETITVPEGEIRVCPWGYGD